MIRYIILLALILWAGIAAHAQRMAPGSVGAEAGIGTFSTTRMAKNYFLTAALTVYGKSGGYQYWALEYSCRQAMYKGAEIPLEAYTFEGGYSLRLLSGATKVTSLNAALTGVAGYETVNRGAGQLQDGAVLLTEEGFIYGLGARLSVDVFISDRLVLVLQGRAKYFWATSGEALRPAIGTALRYNF